MGSWSFCHLPWRRLSLVVGALGRHLLSHLDGVDARFSLEAEESGQMRPWLAPFLFILGVEWSRPLLGVASGPALVFSTSHNNSERHGWALV